MGKADVLGNWCFADNLDKPLDFKDVKIGDYVTVYTRAKSFWGKLWATNGEIKVCCLEKSWHCRVTRF